MIDKENSVRKTMWGMKSASGACNGILKKTGRTIVTIGTVNIQLDR
jgi:hypothetical protein